MDKQFSERLEEALSQRVDAKHYLCPMCKTKMGLMAGLFVHSLHENNINPSIIDPICVPVIPLICMKCGFISQHAVVTLLGPDNWEKFREEYERQEGTHEQEREKIC